MAGIIREDHFNSQAPAAALAVAGMWSAVDAAATIQAASAASAAGDNPRYLNYKRTVSANGFVAAAFTSTTARRRLRLYLTLITAPSGNTAIVYYTNVGTNFVQLFLTTTRTLQLRNVTTAVGVASSALVIGTRYRLEWDVNVPAGQQSAVLYNPNETTAFWTQAAVAGPIAGSAFTQLRIGNPTSATLEYNIAAVAESLDSTELGPAPEMDFGFPMAA